MRGRGLGEVGEDGEAMREQVRPVVGEQNLQGWYITFLCRRQGPLETLETKSDNIQNLFIDFLCRSDVKYCEIVLILPSLYHVSQSKATKTFLRVRMKNKIFFYLFILILY